MTTRTWTFMHPETGWPCVATYDDGLLTVEADRSGIPDTDVDEWEDEDWDECGPKATDYALSDATVARTFCASADAAFRELRAIGAEVRS